MREKSHGRKLLGLGTVEFVKKKKRLELQKTRKREVFLKLREVKLKIHRTNRDLKDRKLGRDDREQGKW